MNKLLKKHLRRIIYRYKADSEIYIRWLKKKGVTVGEGTKFIDPRSGWCDVSRPWLVKIGNNVTITPGVTILTHDYSWSVLCKAYGDIIGNVGKVIIGNNVFVGTNTTILKGVTIGDNVIIGANSLVSKDIPDNCVAAGSPAKVLCSLDEYRKRRKNMYVNEAIEMAQMYYEQYQRVPGKDIFVEHFWLFENDISSLDSCFRDVFNWVYDSKELSETVFIANNKLYESYEELIKLNLKQK